MLTKQVQFKGIDDKGHIFCQPLLFDRGLEKTADGLEMRSKLHPRIQDFVRAVRPTPAGIYVLVNALGAGEYWGSNVNGDLFPEKALINAPANWEGLLANVDEARRVGQAWPYGYPTFMGAYPYKHHVNKDPSRAFGRVELATWNPKMHRVELVVYLDRALCMQFDAMDIIQRIENGEFPDVSMGCKVPYDVCTICENQSKTRNDYCDHALRMMNKILPDGRKVAVRNDFPKFFDISFVFIGADKTAKVMAKLAQKGNQVCMGDFCSIPRLSSDVGEVFSKTADPEDELPSNMGYTKEKALEEMGRKTHKVNVNSGALLSKVASRKEIAKRIATGAGIGIGAGALGNASIKSDKESFKKDVVKDGVAGGVAGLLSKFAYPTLTSYLMEKRASADPAQARGLAQWRRQKLSEMYGIDLSKEANDPIKKKIRVGGVPIWIEWKKGETREYKRNGVVKYTRLMEADYGYIPGTLDSDGEELDAYVGPDKDAKNAYVVRQLKKSGGFDEHKVMIGYSSKSSAKASYLHHMRDCPECFGGIQAIPLSSLVALYGDNKGAKAKEKVACDCHGVGDDCGGSLEKLGSLLFPISKSASHAKLSEIIKSLPAGPFTRETLPRLESAERDIPDNVLDMMGQMPPGNALSTSTMAGMVLKPREFQRMILIGIGERPLADDLDSKGMTFGRTNEVDDSIQLDEGSVDDRLMDVLRRLGIIRDRSAAEPALNGRSASTATAASTNRPFQSIQGEKIASGPLMQKMAAAYNGYRRNVLRKAASISNYLTTDPQLRADLFGSSMAQAFAGGIDKVASASRVLSPNSLAYLVGAYTDRDLHMTNEVVASLAQTGAVVEAA